MPTFYPENYLIDPEFDMAADLVMPAHNMVEGE